MTAQLDRGLAVGALAVTLFASAAPYIWPKMPALITYPIIGAAAACGAVSGWLFLPERIRRAPMRGPVLVMYFGWFVVLGGYVWLIVTDAKNATAPAKSEDAANEQQQAIIDALKGVGHYFYFALMDKLVVGIDTEGRNLYRWYTVAPKGIVREVNYWISFASAKGDKADPGYWALDYRKPPMTIHGGAFVTDRAFPEGDYLIEVDDSNGHWNEWFRVYSQDGQLQQHILIRNPKGEIIYETTDDANFNTP